VATPALLVERAEACGRAGVEIGYLREVDGGVGRFGTVPGEATADVIAAVVDVWPVAARGWGAHDGERMAVAHAEQAL
jgi:hypothetical protein